MTGTDHTDPAPRPACGATDPPAATGRRREREALGRLSREAFRARPVVIVLGGPAGSGRSEILRRTRTELAAVRPPLRPILIDAGRVAQLPPAEAFERLAHQAAVQALALGEGAPAVQGEPDADPALLASRLRRIGLSLSAAEPGRDPESTWVRIFGGLGADRVPLVLLVDGAAVAPAAVLRPLVEAALAAGVPVAMESPPDEAPWLDRPGLDVERVPLSPLSLDEALALAREAAPGEPIEPAWAAAVLMRLGPWPGWVREWAALLSRQERTLPAVRRAEQAYVALLADGPLGRRMEAALAEAVPLETRERALALVADAARQPLEPARASAMLGISSAEAEGVLAVLVAQGLLTRRGFLTTGPREAAPADWADLALARLDDGPRGAAAEFDLLARLLETPREEGAEPERPIHELLLETLGRMRGQPTPEVLFDYANYWEAVGRLPVPRRLEIIERATRTRALPEMAGAACWRAPGGTNLVFGRGWREGRYLRSHEQVWVAIDLSTARSLTTAEIREGLAAAEALERRLGAGHYVRWLIAGDGMPSPEALDLMRRQRLICSCREQITLLARMLAPVEGRRDFPAPPDESASAAPSFSLHLPDPDPPAAEVHGIHRLNLPARAESEFVAAQAAERIARDAGFAPTDVGRIKTAVLEGMLNAIEHSSNPEKQVVLRFALTPQALEIVIENEGRNFDPLAVPEPVAREKVAAPSKRGWGISLMRRFMDEVAYEPAPGLTRLRLVKRRLGEPEPRESRELSGAAASARPGASNHPGSRFGEAPS